MNAFRTISLSVLLLPALAADWNPRRAAEYLDAREKAWLAWPASNIGNGHCVSCHTNVPYLLARPMLRRALGEGGPTRYESELVEGLRARLDGKGMFPSFTKEPLATQGASVEAVFTAMFVGSGRAYERMWALQSKGSWPWFDFQTDPYESAQSGFYGAALAAFAAGNAPAEFRKKERVEELVEYLQKEQASQPLHNRLMLLWASSRLPEALTEAARNRIIADTFGKQAEDGGWTSESLGPFMKHEGVPASVGSNAYATSVAALGLRAGGVSKSDPRMARALAWLQSHQDAETGSWRAVSMNKVRPAGTMPSEFMSEVATAYAVMALLASDVTYPGDYRVGTHEP